MGYSPGEKRGSGKIVIFQGSSSLNTRVFHPRVQENKPKRWEVCMDEEGAPEKTET